MPFRYGIATMTEFPLLFLSLVVEWNGKTTTGVASDLLPPKWFTKIPDKAPAEEIDELLHVIQNAVSHSLELVAPNVFEFWKALYERQNEEAKRESLPGLLIHFGTSLVERAMLDAAARSSGHSFSGLIRSSEFGLNLGSVHKELSGHSVEDFLPEAPLRSVIARHTIGLGDPLTEGDLNEVERVDDGLPESLDQCIRRYALKHFKIKVSGQRELDLPRLTRILDVIFVEAGSSAAFTLDANEQFRSMDEFQSFWEDLKAAPWFSRFFERLLFVEQPLHRDVALSAELPSESEGGQHWPRFIIDESDGDLDALVCALRLGYSGTSHKNCKGVIKGISNRCLIEKRKREDARGSLLMSGEDLCNQGPVSLQQDLAVMAFLGIESVERNGHHYCRGLSGLPRTVQELVETAHQDLYARFDSSWATLRIESGRIALDTVNQAPFGYGFNVPIADLPTLDEWQRAR